MKTLRLVAIVGTLFFLFSVRVHARNYDPSQYINDTETITARAETEKYYWIGTNHGVYFINKKRHKVFHMTSKNSILLSDSITCIAAKSDGEVYVGTPRGIIRYDNFAFLPITVENSSLQSNNITSLACLDGTEIYAGTFDGGITVFSGGISKTFTAKNAALASNHITFLKKIGADSLVAHLGDNTFVGIHNRRFTPLR